MCLHVYKHANIYNRCAVFICDFVYILYGCTGFLGCLFHKDVAGGPPPWALPQRALLYGLQWAIRWGLPVGLRSALCFNKHPSLIRSQTSHAQINDGKQQCKVKIMKLNWMKISSGRCRARKASCALDSAMACHADISLRTWSEQ